MVFCSAESQLFGPRIGFSPPCPFILSTTLFHPAQLPTKHPSTLHLIFGMCWIGCRCWMMMTWHGRAENSTEQHCAAKSYTLLPAHLRPSLNIFTYNPVYIFIRVVRFL